MPNSYTITVAHPQVDKDNPRVEIVVTKGEKP